MANTKSAAKRARQTTVRAQQNRRSLSAVKSSTKALRSAIKAGTKSTAQELQVKFASTVDKAAKTGRIHKNKANRLKSRANKAISALATA